MQLKLWILFNVLEPSRYGWPGEGHISKCSVLLFSQGILVLQSPANILCQTPHQRMANCYLQIYGILLSRSGSTCDCSAPVKFLCFSMVLLLYWLFSYCFTNKARRMNNICSLWLVKTNLHSVSFHRKQQSKKWKKLAFMLILVKVSLSQCAFEKCNDLEWPDQNTASVPYNNITVRNTSIIRLYL